ncbi:MAG: PAS domain-containing protein [Proteobacteria bacterium]|nr:PAS domain-containing protein [Pseudomonadota bacterium]
MIFEAVILWTVVTLLLCGLTAFIVTRRQAPAGDVFRDLPEPIMRVSTSRLEPIVCNRAFSDALGYSSPAECCRLFSHYPHLPEDNLYQIWHRNRVVATRSVHTRLNDRHGQTVTNELRLQVNHDCNAMDIIIVVENQAGTLADLLLTQQAVPYLQLDADLRVRRANRPAADRFALVAGDFLPERVFPGSARVRLTSIYRRRLARHGRLHLHHRTLVANGSVDGTWWVASVDPDTFHVLFREDRGVDLSLGSPLFDLQDDAVGFWELDLGLAEITHNQSWLTGLGFGDLEVTCSLDAWLALVSPFDRDPFRRTLEGAEGPFVYAYQMANGSAIQLQVETRGFILERDGQGKPLRLQGIHINRSTAPGDRTSGRSPALSSLQTIAGNLGFMIELDEAAGVGEALDNLLNDHQPELERILSALADFLVSEFGDETERTVVIPAAEQMHCSLCSGAVMLPVTFVVRCRNVRLPIKLGRHLLAPGFSMSRVSSGDGTSLYGINRQLHARGGHLGVSLTGGLSLRISLPGISAETPAPQPLSLQPEKHRVQG